MKGQGAKPFVLAISAYCALLLGIASGILATGANQIVQRLWQQNCCTEKGHVMSCPLVGGIITCR